MSKSWPPGPRRPTVSSAEIHVWRAELERPEWPPHDLLPAAERERAKRMRRPRDRRRWAASRWALRSVLARYLDRDPAAIELSLSEHGKPTLDGVTGLRFNLSHSGELVLIAVAKGREVGVDIEQIDPRRDVLMLLERALDPPSAAAVRQAPPPARATVFHEAWTRREAVVKCAGSGLAGPPPEHPFTVSALDAGPCYAAALAVSGPEAPALRCFELLPT